MAADSIVTLTDSNFESEVTKSSQPVLVDFWAEWCGPCKMVAPILDELANEYAGKIKIGKVDIDQHQGLASQFGIRAIPTIILFRNGREVARETGAVPRARLDALVARGSAGQA